MADVCIIYAREDASNLPSALEKLLSPCYSVWWDKKIRQGKYREVILGQLRIAGCVVPIWSPSANNSMVIEEAEHARHFNVPLLPIITHDGLAPLGFGRDHMSSVIGWNGELDHPEILKYVEEIKNVLANRKGPKCRPISLNPKGDIKLPVFFLSLSSYETKVSPREGIRALSALRAKSVLVSAQDTINQTSRHGSINIHLKRIQKNGGFVLLDSGNYEEGRRLKLQLKSDVGVKQGSNWTLDDYHSALVSTTHDMAFCFDRIKPPANDLNKIVAAAVNAVKRDQKLSAHPVLPIVHLPIDRRYKNILVQHAPEAVFRVAKALQPPMIGIPERELGDGIITRVKTMKKIRLALDELYYYQPVHILGTGDPIAIALLSAAGADSFDGLEWCRFVADDESARLYPIPDYDFFRWQDKLSPFIGNMSDGEQELSWKTKMAVHNIEFYTNWMAEFQEVLRIENRLVEFMTNLLPNNGMNEVREILWEDK